MNYRVFTDGSCVTSTKQGGYGYVIVDESNKQIYEDYKAYNNTTNNRMELSALLAAMTYMNGLVGEEDSVIFYTDSSYIANCFREKWYKKWLANGWRTSNRMPVKNVDLWKQILHEYRHSKIMFDIQKIAGHCGFEWNEYADGLANRWRILTDEKDFITDKD